MFAIRTSCPISYAFLELPEPNNALTLKQLPETMQAINSSRESFINTQMFIHVEHVVNRLILAH